MELVDKLWLLTEATHKPLICEAALIQMQTYDWQKNSEAPVQNSSQITSFYHVEVKTKVFETTVYGFVYLFFLHCSNLFETSSDPFHVIQA